MDGASPPLARNADNAARPRTPQTANPAPLGAPARLPLRTPYTSPFSTPIHSRLLAWVGLVGIVEFVAAILALHATALARDPMPHHMSEYAHSRWPMVWVAGAYAAAFAAFCLTAALKPYLPHRSMLARAALALMLLAGLGALLVATFPVDQGTTQDSLSARIHNDAAMPAFAFSGTAMVLLVPDLKGRRGWKPFADASLVLGILVMACAVLYVWTDRAGLPEVAIVQRAMVAFIAAWLALLALQILRKGRLHAV